MNLKKNWPTKKWSGAEGCQGGTALLVVNWPVIVCIKEIQDPTQLLISTTTSFIDLTPISALHAHLFFFHFSISNHFFYFQFHEKPQFASSLEFFTSWAMHSIASIQISTKCTLPLTWCRDRKENPLPHCLPLIHIRVVSHRFGVAPLEGFPHP